MRYSIKEPPVRGQGATSLSGFEGLTFRQTSSFFFPYCAFAGGLTVLVQYG